MRQALYSIVLICATALPCAAQAPVADSPTMQQVLTEVRALRNELKISQARILSSQILLSRQQTQQTVIARLGRRLDDARSRLAQIQADEKRVSADIAQTDEALSAAENPADQKHFTDELARLKSSLAGLKITEQERSIAAFDTDEQLRTEQDTLDSLNAQLDALVKKSETAEAAAAPAAH